MAAVCLLFSWLILPAFIYIGYTVAAARVAREGGRELPPWVNVGEKLKDGFLLTIAALVWSIPAIVLYALGFALAGCGTTTDGTSTCSNGGALALFITLAVLWGLLLLVLYAPLWSQYLRGGFGACFKVGAVFGRVGANVGLAIIVALMYLVAGLVGGLGIILLFVGVLLTAPYGALVWAHLFGQYARITDAAVTRV